MRVTIGLRAKGGQVTKEAVKVEHCRWRPQRLPGADIRKASLGNALVEEVVKEVRARVRSQTLQRDGSEENTWR